MIFRSLLLSITIFVFNYTDAQVHKYWVGDTANVECYYEPIGLVIPDTIFYFKGSFKIPKGDTVVLYWDKTMKHRNETRIIGDTIHNDTIFYENGKIDMIYYTVLRRKESNSFSDGWYRDGMKKQETIFKGKEEQVIFYYNSGKVRQRDISFTGLSPYDSSIYIKVYTERWCENGTLIGKDSTNTLVPRKIIRYHCNGAKEAEFTLYQMHPIGKYSTWYPNGQPKEIGQYYDTTAANKLKGFNNKIWFKQGEWRYYAENGKLIRTVIYKDGDILEEKKY
jgi:antitoxin component YwqK of YwqJK toxin-antitoxin module